MCEKLKALYIESYYNYQKASAKKAKEVGIMYGIFLGVRKCCNILYSQKTVADFQILANEFVNKRV